MFNFFSTLKYMSFEHKYLKYKQKYLDLKKEVALLKSQIGNVQAGGNAPSESDTFNISALSDTPKLEQAKQLGGYLVSSESDATENKHFLNSESEDSLANVDNLTETPKKHDMVVSINSSETETSMPKENAEEDEKSEKSEEESVADEEEGSSDDDIEKALSDDDEEDEETNVDSDDDMEGGADLETSISELEEIFSQLGGKKKSKKEEEDSDLDSSSMSSLSSLDSSSSEFDL